MKLKNTEYVLWCCVLVWLTACSADTGGVNGDGGNMLQMGDCLTRSGVLSPVNATRLAFFLASGSDARPCAFTYYAEADRWGGNATTQEGEVYHLYGFMPAEAVTTSAVIPLSGDFADGAVMTLGGLSPVTTQDVDFIVGVKGGEDVSQASDITEWSYLYEGQAEGHNNVHFLLDHLYAAVSLQFKVSENYSKLRTIKLKEVRLQPSSDRQVNVAITQAAGAAPVFSYAAGTASATIPVLLSSTGGEELSTETAVEAEAFLMPGLEGLTLVSTYDVYDKSGNCLRSDCTSENNILGRIRMEQGARTTLMLTVNPTYLLVLSDPDFNNPQVTVTE